MTTATIPIQIDSDAAQRYAAAAPEMQAKLRLLVSLWLREFTSPATSLSALMDAISDKAQARGLTPRFVQVHLIR